MRLSKLINMWVYRRTEKPEHYKRVKNPPKTAMDKILRPQDARQQQFNNWCKRNGVYCGSYLPEDPNLLTKKGWREISNEKGETKQKEFQRKSSGQIVRYDEKKFKKGRWEDEHYHWENAKSVSERQRVGNKKRYIDRYGNTCKKGSPQSHLAPKDKDYKFER